MVLQNVFTSRTADGLARDVESAIRSGALAPGDPLPTVRALAADLGVSSGTVAAAYRELRRRGVAAGAGRAGTRVRHAPAVAPRQPLAVPPGVRDLRSGGPDPSLLPTRPMMRVQPGAYGAPPVLPALHRVAADHLSADGIDPTHLSVVGGALDGVERVLGAWLLPGDRVAVEDPGYTAVLDLLGALGLVPVPLALDDRGVIPHGLAAALDAGARTVIVTPRAQNPTGWAWDRARVDEIRAVIGRHPEVLVVEDDHAGLVSGVPALTVNAGRERWATVRSVSKWLGPDLRVAVLAADPTTSGRVAGRQALGTGWVSHLLQQVVADLWSAPSTPAVLAAAAATYASRRVALAGALATEGFAATGSSGLTTWVPVGDEHAVVAGMLGSGWAVSPGDRFRIGSPSGIRIAFATLAANEAPRVAADLAACAHRLPVRTG
jgi:DNA-binding transcriptional MocR family regulator